MPQTEEIVNLLKHFGLSTKEAKVYLASLSLGPSSIQDISKNSKVNRATVHLLVERLKEKRMIVETRKGKKRLICAEDPSSIKTFIEEEQKQLQQMENAMEILIPKINDFKNRTKSHDSRPNILFYDGEEGFFEVCERSLSKAKKEILFISALDYFRSISDPEYDIKYYIPERIKRKIKLKALVTKNKLTMQLKRYDKKELRESRFIPEKNKFESTIFIYGDEFSMITSHAPFMAIVVQSNELTFMMKQLFNAIWDCADTK